METEIKIEKDEVKIDLNGTEYLCHLEADLVIETTEGSGGVMRSGSSSYEDLLEAPSSDCVDVLQATTTLTLFNDHGEKVGTILVDGKQFFEDTHGELEVDDG